MVVSRFSNLENGNDLGFIRGGNVNSPGGTSSGRLSIDEIEKIKKSIQQGNQSAVRTNPGTVEQTEQIDTSKGSASSQNTDQQQFNVEEFNQRLIQNPDLPDGTKLQASLQQLNPDEIIQMRTLGVLPDISAIPASVSGQFSPAQVEAFQIGQDTPQAQAAIGRISEDSLVKAEQITGVPVIDRIRGEVSQEVEAARIEPSQEFVIQAAKGTLSDDAKATAAVAQASDQFLKSVSELNQEIIDTPIDPRATVKEQFSQLMDFEPDEIPGWAKGAFRAAQQQMAARGIPGSTIAGEAITTSLMQAALPIAVQDAQIFSTWELEKLDRRAQAGILKASHLATLDVRNAEFKQQAAIRNADAALQIDVTNLNNEQQARVINAQQALRRAEVNEGFEQQAEIENARNLLTMDVTNLETDARIAVENARLALSVESQNLNARQQAAVENARAFLNMDLSNLDRQQQTAIVNTQSRLQAMLSDQAAINASRNFNAASENQVNQFFAGLSTDISRFNASQALGAAEVNATLRDSRDKFNVQNTTFIDQANTQWLRDISTRNTALINEVNFQNAANMLNLSTTALANELTLLRDNNSFIFQASENEKERVTRRAIAELNANTQLKLFNKEAKLEIAKGIGGFAADIFGDVLGNKLSDIIG